MRAYKVVRDDRLSEPYEPRFVVIDEESGQVLDDAQGYGYKSAQKAHAAWAYKNRDRSKDAEKKAKERAIRAWLKEHKDFAAIMEDEAFLTAKGEYGPDARFGAKAVKDLLKEAGLQPDFTAGELLRVWRGRGR